MSRGDAVSRIPEMPLRGDVRPVDGSGLAGHDLLARTRELSRALRAAPEVVGRLTDDEVTELAGLGIALTRAGEALAVAATVAAVDRGTTQASTSANTAQWVRSLGAGVEPGQAKRIADVAEEIAGRDGLVRIGPSLADVLAAADRAVVDTGGEDAGGDAVSQVVDADPTGRLLLAEAVASGAVTVRAAHRAVQEAPRVRRLIPTASKAEVLSWFLALGDEATDRDRRMLTRRLVAQYDPDQLCRDETTQQSREKLTMYDLPCGMVRLAADLSRGPRGHGAAGVGQAVRASLATVRRSRERPCPRA